MELLECARRTIRRHGLAAPGTSVVVALSGGSDSVALAHLLLDLEADGDLRVAGLAHLNHRLRDAADADQQFCERLAGSLRRPLLVDEADVGALARRARRSVEDAARQARYAFFERARLHFEADVVAVGHTRDDQAETFLLRLIRGAGARGLAAMHPRRGTVVRPLLDCRRADLKAYLQERGIPFVHDASNDDVTVTRNRVRAELLPLIAARFNPSIVDVLANEAEVAREEWRWMEEEAVRAGAALCRWTDRQCRIAVGGLNALPVALARLVLREAMSRASGGRAVSFAHVEQARRLSLAGGDAIDVPGHRLERDGPDVVLTGRPAGAVGRTTPPAAASNLFRYPLSIPGEVVIAETGGVVSAELAADLPPRADAGNGAHVAVVQLEGARRQLAVRNRRPGDRFRPIGLGGGKKLQDYFVDRKVARERRDAVPIVVDESDRIVWVAGYGIDERFRVMDPAQGVVVLRLRQV